MSISKPRWLPYLVLMCLTIVASTTVLARVLWVYGANVNLDTRSYIQAGFNLAHGNGYVLTRYNAITDSLMTFPLTHYPPFTSVVYAIGLWLHIPPHHIPMVLLLIGWVLFLVGSSLLTYRLGAPPFLVALALLQTVLTSTYWFNFQYMLSEAFFLPLLVWLMVLLVDLPATYAQKPARVLLALILLALLPLTRYAGVFVVMATGIWVAWWFLLQWRWRALLVGGGFLALTALPFGSWVLYNALYTSVPLSHHLQKSQRSFSDGLIAFAQESSRFLLPSLEPFPPWRSLTGWLILAGVLVAAMLVAVWRFAPERERTITTVPRTPLWLFIILYSLLYTVAQPWFSFHPIDRRDVTTLLCLFHPWLFAAVGRVLPKRWSYSLLGTFLLINIAMATSPLFLKELSSQAYHDSSRARSAAHVKMVNHVWDYFGAETWLYLRPPQTGDLPQYHPRLYAWLQSFDADESNPDMVVLTNGTMLFDTHMPVAVEYPHITHPPGYVTDWVNTGACSSRYNTMVILFDWDELAENFARLRQKVEQKCPDLEPISFPHSVVYRLKPATEEPSR